MEKDELSLEELTKVQAGNPTGSSEIGRSDLEAKLAMLKEQKRIIEEFNKEPQKEEENKELGK